MRRWWLCLVLIPILSACSTGFPQVTPTVAPTNTPTPASTRIAEQPTNTPVIRLTSTPTITLQATITRTTSPTPTVTGTASPTDIPTRTPSPTATNTPTATSTGTLTPTRTPSNTPTPSITPTLTPSRTPTNTLTPTQTSTPTETPTPTETQPPTLTPFLSPTPSITPSETPTSTVTNTPTETFTPTVTNTPTITLTPVPSVTPTLTATPTVTLTLTPSDTPTLTPTPLPTITPTDTPTLTPTFTDTATFTPVPSLTPTLTPTPTITLTPSQTFTPTVTLTATFDRTAAASDLMTRAAERELTEQARQPTWTPPPVNPPTSTIPPTLNVTPTFVTATPGGIDIGLIVTAATSTPEIVENPPTDAPIVSPTAVPFTPTALPPEIVQQGFLTPIPRPISFTYTSGTVASYSFAISPGAAVNLSGDMPANPYGIRRFDDRPGGPGYVYTDSVGMVRFSFGDFEGVLTDSPFYDGYAVGSAAENKNRVIDIGWAPNGQWFYFIVSPPPGTSYNDAVGAGLWFWQPGVTDFGRTFALLRDCMGGESCALVQGHQAGSWETIKAEFSPSSTLILATLWLPQEGRQALEVVGAVTDPSYANASQPLHRYDTGYWMRDGNIIVSGRRPSDGNVIIGITDSFLNNEQVIYDATGSGMWMQDAVQRGDGTIVALGRECCPGGPLRLYQISNGVATAISGDIGPGAPSRVEWSRDRSQAVLTINGQQHVVSAGGGSASLFTGATGSLSAESGGGLEGVPSGVVPGSRYAPGQQVQFIGTENRNLRDLPSTQQGAVVDRVLPGEFVGIIAGPYSSQGFEWWYVSNARSVLGWMAASDGGTSLLSP